MPVLWIFVVALGSFSIGGMLRRRGGAILDDPGRVVDRRLGGPGHPSGRGEPAGSRNQPSDPVTAEDHRWPDASTAADDHDDRRAAGGGDVDGEWSLLIIPICVCAVLLFVAAVGGLPGG